MDVIEACVSDLKSARAALVYKRMFRRNNTLQVSSEAYKRIADELKDSGITFWTDNYIDSQMMNWQLTIPDLDGHNAVIEHRQYH